MATTRFSKPWPCARIRLGATLSLWRRVHCERVAWQAWGMVRPGHRFAWQAAGIGRVGGVSRVCRGHAAVVLAALCRGDWVRGVFCTRVANVRFAWQAAGIGCVERVSRACRRACWRRGDWRRGVLRARMILRAVTCVSRGRRGTPDACPRAGRHWRVDPRGRCGETCIWTLVRVRFTLQVWGKVATGGVAKVDSRGLGKRARSVRFAWQAWGMVRAVASLGIVLRGRRRELCAVAKIAGFHGPVRLIACACARARVRRCEIVAGAGNPWICGCELGADVCWNAAAGCVGCIACAALPWNAVAGCDDGRRARRVCGVCGAVPWGLLVGALRGCRCAMGIAAGHVAWVPLGGAVPWGLLVCVSHGWRCAMGIAGQRVSRGWRRVLRIADQGVVWVAPCH